MPSPPETENLKTGAYWAAVQHTWTELYAQHDRFTLRSAVHGKPLFEEHLAYARKLKDGAPFDATDAERHSREIIGRFVETKLP